MQSYYRVYGPELRVAQFFKTIRVKNERVWQSWVRVVLNVLILVSNIRIKGRVVENGQNEWFDRFHENF